MKKIFRIKVSLENTDTGDNIFVYHRSTNQEKCWKDMPAEVSMSHFFSWHERKKRRLLFTGYFGENFQQNFNLSFDRSRIDDCSKCGGLTKEIKDLHLNDMAKRVAFAEHIVHKPKACKYF